MNRAASLKIINPLLGLFMISQGITGLTGALLPRELFDVAHKGGGLVLAVLVLLHVILNWNWVKGTYWHRKPV